MSKSLERLLVEAIQNRRPMLVNPTADELRQKAEELQQGGKLICASCKKPIRDPDFRTHRIAFGPHLEGVAHLHPSCEAAFLASLASEKEPGAG